MIPVQTIYLFFPHISSKRDISAMNYKKKAWQRLLSSVILELFWRAGTFDKRGFPCQLKLLTTKIGGLWHANTKTKHLRSSHLNVQKNKLHLQLHLQKNKLHLQKYKRYINILLFIIISVRS